MAGLAGGFAGNKKRKLEEQKEAIRQEITKLESMSPEEKYNYDYELGSVEGDVTEKLGILKHRLHQLSETDNFKLPKQ